MARVAVITDSASDLDPAEAAEAGVTVVPLIVTFGPDSYRAGVEMSTEAFWERMTAPDAPFPTTAASSPGAFKEAYEAAFADGAEADRLDPRRRHAVGHDQERPDRARDAQGS